MAFLRNIEQTFSDISNYLRAETGIVWIIHDAEMLETHLDKHWGTYNICDKIYYTIGDDGNQVTLNLYVTFSNDSQAPRKKVYQAIELCSDRSKHHINRTMYEITKNIYIAAQTSFECHND